MKKYTSYITPQTQTYSLIEMDAPICWDLPTSGNPSSPKSVPAEPTY